MKRISTFLSLMFVGSVLFAQSPLKPNSGVAFTDSKLKAPDADRVIATAKTKSGAPSCGSVIYSFDFASGIPAGWANYGTPSAALWEYRGPGTTPDNTVGGRGAFASGDPLVSSSAANGFMIFDSDYLDNNGSSATMGQGAAPAPHVGVLATSPLDFSNYPAVSINLESYARTFYGQQWLIFSTDGGVNFTDSIQLHADLAVNAGSDNPVSYSINVSAEIGGQLNVVVGFLFDGTPGNANGNGYYEWLFDDVAFTETPDNDLAIADWDVDQGTKLGLYGSTPINEVEEFVFSVLAENKGAAGSSSANLDVETFNVTGSVNQSNTMGGALASATTLIINEAAGYTPVDTGFYDVTVNLSGDSVDCNPVDNSVDYFYYISEAEDLYALDHFSVSSYLGTNSFTGGEDGFQMLNIYEFQDTFYLKNVWMRLSALTSEGATGYIVIYDTTGATYGGGGQFATQSSPLYKSDEYTFTAQDGPNGFTAIPCNFKIPPGGYYIGVEAYSTGNIDTVRIAIDETMPQDPYASLIYILNSGLYTNPDAFMIRLNQTNCTGVNISITGTVTDNQTVGAINNVQITGGEAPYAISWTGPNLFTSQAQNLNTVTNQGTYTISAVDRNGCDASQSFTVGGIVSTGDVNGKVAMDVYPNPSNGLFNLNFNNIKAGSYNVEVRNMVGQVVHTGSVQLTKDGNTTLDLSNISKGAYLLNISGKNVEINESIVIK
jgi:hypothetical protein